MRLTPHQTSTFPAREGRRNGGSESTRAGFLYDMRTPQIGQSKWDILPTNHPTVIRRLVKELNYREAGFYFNGHRFNQARFRKGNLEVRMGAGHWTVAGFESVFGDGSGGVICASRTRCGQ